MLAVQQHQQHRLVPQRACSDKWLQTVQALLTVQQDEVNTLVAQIGGIETAQSGGTYLQQQCQIPALA